MYTRYDPSDPKCEEKKLLLDIVIISKNLERYYDRMVIDTNLVMTPYRTKNKQLVYSDHYAILVKFKGIPKKPKVTRNGIRETIWNTNKKGGWSKYYGET